MKKITFAILAFAMMFAGNDVFAQGKYGADSAECIKYLSYYKEYFKQKSYDEAIPNWREAYTRCPATANQNMLIDGTTLVRRLISKNSRNTFYRDELIDTLINIHKVRAQYYPKYAVTAYNNLGTDIFNYVKDNPQKAYLNYENVIQNNQAETKPSIFLFQFNSALSMYNDGLVDEMTVINNYQRNMSILDQIVPENDEEKEQVEKIKNDMGSLFATSSVATCDNLIELYGPRLEADPDNISLASSIVKTMGSIEDCQDNDLFLAAVTTMNNLEPSANSAYFLYKLHSAKGNVNDAISYLEAAIAREDSDLSQDADFTFELATYCFKNGRSAKAFELASSVPAMKSSLAGKAYFLIGNIWGSTSCGGDEISRRAPYWVACDYMNKAKAADESLVEEANRQIAQYSRYFPQTAEAFMYDVTDGQAYTVVCGGMRATTTVRTVK